MEHWQAQNCYGSLIINTGDKVSSTPVPEDGEAALARILSKLVHLDLTKRITNKDAEMVAHGAYCDIFAGLVASQCIQHRRVMTATENEVKVAIKRIRVRLSKDITLAKTLARELGIWSRLDHPNILPLLGYMLERDYPSLISEWIENGTVREFLKRNPTSDITYLALGIAKGLNYLHDQDIVHSDVKGDNILISKFGEPLICDFGISRMLDSSQSNFVSTTHDDSVRGSARWMAQELTASAGAKHSKESDVWAYGMTLYEMLTKQLPYANLRNEAQVVLAIVNGELPSLPNFSDTCVTMAYNSFLKICWICTGCWAKVPMERPPMSQITASLSLLSNQPCKRTQSSATVEDAGACATLPATSEAAARLSNPASATVRAADATAYPLTKRGKLPKSTTDILKDWILHHSDHPYPSEWDKEQLCQATELSMSQVSNWMINARRRFLAPAQRSCPELVPNTHPFYISAVSE